MFSLEKRRPNKEYLICISALAVEQTDTDSSQTCKAKIHKGMGMDYKSRWDEEVWPK